jgi:hypothetical protein
LIGGLSIMPAASGDEMGVELLFAYVVLMLTLGPLTMLYGFFIVARRRVRLTPGMVLRGGSAVIAGVATIIVGFTLTYFLWYMGRYLPH